MGGIKKFEAASSVEKIKEICKKHEKENYAINDYIITYESLLEWANEFNYDQNFTFWDYEYLNNEILKLLAKKLEIAEENQDLDLYFKVYAICGADEDRLYNLRKTVMEKIKNGEKMPPLTTAEIRTTLLNYFTIDEVEKMDFTPVIGAKKVVDSRTSHYVIPGVGHIY